jgi:hypothetical protein
VSLADSDTVQLLRRLQHRLVEQGQRVQGDMMGKLADQIAASEDLDVALERLYSVRGWDGIALRLLWYAERARATGAGAPLEALLDFQVEELHRLLLARPGADHGVTNPTPDQPSGAVTGQVFEVLHEFCTTLEELKQSAFSGERIEGVRRGLFDTALSQGGRLHQVCSARGNETLAQFAAAFSLFFRYVIEHELFDDVRVAHVIDHTSQVLGGIVEEAGAEDYGPLVQTIDMLHNPETLLE